MVSGTSFQESRDNHGSQDTTKDLVLIPPFTETIIIEEGPTQKQTQDIGHAFILGHSVNGVLGVANGTDGSQITLGSGGLGDLTVTNVVNPNNVFHEHFRFTDYIDNDNTTGDIDTSTDYIINMTNGEQYQTKVIFKDSQDIFNATPRITFNGGKTTFIAKGTSISVSITEGKNQYQ